MHFVVLAVIVILVSYVYSTPHVISRLSLCCFPTRFVGLEALLYAHWFTAMVPKSTGHIITDTQSP